MHEPRHTRSVAGAPILVVLSGTELDSSVLSLAAMVAEASGASLSLVHPVVVPSTLPLVAYSHLLATEGEDGVLGSALAVGVSGIAEAFTLICRQAGRALVAELEEIGCATIVIGAPQGGWLTRWRGQRVIRYLMRHAPCRTYLVQETVDPPLQERRVVVRS